MPRPIDIEPAMSARTHACVFMRAPIHEIVPALAASARVVGYLVGRKTVR
jgi:hypothetical protein